MSNLLLFGGQGYAKRELAKYMARVRNDGGIVQNPTYVYEWYKLSYDLGRIAGNNGPIAWRRKYNALGGVKLNGISNTNLLTYSQQFENAAWTKTNTTADDDAITAPDGTLTAATLTATSAGGFLQQSNFTIGAGNNGTFSIWIRRISGTGTIQLRNADGANTTITITSAWERFSITSAGASGTFRTGITMSSSGDVIGIWGAQLQTGTIATDYIPTTNIAASATQNYVQTWYDFENTSPVNAIQSTAANQPYYGLDSSLPSNVRGLTFDGSNDVMSVADLGIFNNQAAGTLIACVKDANRAGGDIVHDVIHITTSGGGVRAAVATRNTATNFGARGRRLDADTVALSTSAGSNDGLNVLVGSYIWGGNTLQLNVNGTPASSATFSSGAGSTSATDSTLFNIGANNSTTNRLQGIITDIAAGRIVLTSAQAAAFRALERSFYPALP